jgi:hypothetical protein
MPITKYEGMTLTKKTLVLEECWLINCVLKECVIFYAGGPFEIANATFDQCQWKFQGHAALTLQLLGMIGLLPKPQTPVQMTPPTGPLN